MNRERMLRDLAALVAIPSVSGNAGMTRAALSWTLARAREWGFRTGVTREGDAGYAEIGEGPVTLGVLAHVDVVGPGDLGKWKSDPYTLFERDGMLCGRGVEDDKGPVVQSLHAMKAVLGSGAPLRKRIRLIVGTSEESEWIDMAHYKAQFGTPDYGYSPDAAFPVFNIEKGYADVKLYFDAAGVESLCCGDSPNTIPSHAEIRRAGAALETFEGVSGHSSAPEKADNAILKLARSMPDFAFSRFITDMFGDDYHGIRLGVDDGSDTFEGIFVEKTVCVPTMLRLENGQAMLNVNLRLRVGLKPDALLPAFERHAKKYGYTCTLSGATAPMYVDPRRPFIAEMNAEAARMGVVTGCLVASGASYCGTIPNHVGWGPVLPPDEGSAHQENERMPREDFFRVAELYKNYLMRAAQSET